MQVLIIGSGGREHALTWKLAQSPKVKNIFITPGNAGTAKIGTNLNLTKTEEIIAWATEHRPDLVVVGPDDYLADGIVDRLTEMGIPAFGPTRAAAEIEWSKSFAKDLMKKAGIPTAKFETFNNYALALAYLKKQKSPIVIKASGLALGKGVIVAETLEDAEKALKEIMVDKVFGKAGDEVVIEEYLSGEEISIHAICDGVTALLFPTSQDRKRIFDGDTGPNTGGMGTITPVPWVSEQHLNAIETEIIAPLLKAMSNIGRPFKGLLYPGIMITESGPKVIEFNARFGDPETQVYMRTLESDLADLCLASIEGRLAGTNIHWSPKSASCIVSASGGYPGSYEKGKVISGLEKASDPDVVIFHAGTKFDNELVVTNGGRVLGVTATGVDLNEALEKSYKALQNLNFEGMYFRKDIGTRKK